jgi:glycosyltransferase involved in cell wall biosynthesis
MSAAVPIGLLIGDWLRPSETFIYEQLIRAERTRPFVCARRALSGVERDFPFERVCSLGQWEEIFFKLTRRSPTFSRFLRQNEIRLLHAHFGVNGAHALELADELGVPLVVSFHGHDVAGLLPKNRYKRRYFQYQMLRERLWQRADLLLAASKDLAERLVHEHGAPKDKLVVHELGVDLARFRYHERTKPERLVLSVGRLVEKKGLRYGIEAFARAFPKGDARYEIIGEGPLLGELRELVTKLGVEGQVSFLGALSHQRVHERMLAADVLSLPSVTGADGDLESGVLVAKEAAATGLPVVGSRHGGIPEIIDDGVTGYLVEERAVADFADRLRVVVGDDALRWRLGTAAAARVARDYDAVRQNARLESLLLGLLGPVQ